MRVAHTRWTALAAALVLVGLLGVPVFGADDAVPVLDTASFWRTHTAFGWPMYLKDGQLTRMPHKWHGGPGKYAWRPTSFPASGWQQADFDDSGWTRLAGPMIGSVQTARNRSFTDQKSAHMTHLAMRGRFGVKDPSRAKDLSLEIAYRGGIAVYLNGTEIAREHLAKNAKPDTFAEPTRPGEKKPRTLSCTLPTRVLKRGANVLAVEVHRAPYLESEMNIHTVKWPQGVNIERASCAVDTIRLSAPKRSASAVVGNVARPKGFQVWNSNPLAGDHDQDYGDPFETLGPIRLVGTRRGAFSGKVVVGCDKPIKGLRGVATALVRKGGGSIPASNVQVRYALPGPTEVGSNYRYIEHVRRFKALEDVPPAEVPVYANGVRKRSGLKTPDIKVVPGAVCPVWVTVEVPANAPPGDYTGTLTITATGQRAVRVPIELAVSAWALPDPKDYTTFVEMVQSPETLAIGYEVPLWSEAHWKLIDRSLAFIGKAGGQSVYVPLICETNLGNAESMVRWIRKPDKTYTHDFSIMARYLDLVEKHMGKPEVMCFWMWDTFLERTLGGRGDQKWNSGDVVKALEAQKGHGPDVTLLDAKTGKTSKHEMPMFITEKSYRLWKPVADEIKRRMAKRGWTDTMMLGCMCDYQPSKESRVHLNRLFPDVKWVSHAHQHPRKDLPVGYAAVVWWSYHVFNDPDVKRAYGWKNPELVAHFTRPMRNWFPITQFRLTNEICLVRNFRGSARWGADYFPALMGKQGRAERRLGGTIAGRFPKSHWHNLRIEVNFLEKGKRGAIATAEYEMFREGAQECEARIFIERALTDKKLRAKLGEKTAERLQTLLDERIRNVRQGLGTFMQSGHYVQHHTRPSSWMNRPTLFGTQWYVGSGWQENSKKLFDAAAEVTAKLN